VSAVAAAHHAHAHARPSRPDGYTRRRPEDTVLHQVLRAHFPAFLERADEAGGLPKFVEREFEANLECGLLERGLVHLRCAQCGEDRVVAFSCKRRGFGALMVSRGFEMNSNVDRVAKTWGGSGPMLGVGSHATSRLEPRIRPSSHR